MVYNFISVTFDIIHHGIENNKITVFYIMSKCNSHAKQNIVGKNQVAYTTQLIIILVI